MTTLFDAVHEATVDEQVARQALRPVLSAAKEIERGARYHLANSDVVDLDIDTAGPSARREHHGVTPVAVGAEQVRIEHDDPQHGDVLAIQSRKAV
jgi:hypothetical protein